MKNKFEVIIWDENLDKLEKLLEEKNSSSNDVWTLGELLNVIINRAIVNRCEELSDSHL